MAFTQTSRHHINSPSFAKPNQPTGLKIELESDISHSTPRSQWATQILDELLSSDSQARCSLTIGLFSPAFKEGKI